MSQNRQQRGLSRSVLGDHLGIEVPAVVRRGGEGTATEAPAASAGRANDLVTSTPTPSGGSVDAAVHTLQAMPRALLPVPASSPVPAPPIASAVPEARRPLPPHSAAQDAPEADDEAAEADDELPVSRAIYRVGTQRNPYQRQDGTKTQKLSFTGYWGLKRDIERHCLDFDLDRSEWIVSVLVEAMERQRREAADQQPSE